MCCRARDSRLHGVDGPRDARLHGLTRVEDGVVRYRDCL